MLVKCVDWLPGVPNHSSPAADSALFPGLTCEPVGCVSATIVASQHHSFLRNPINVLILAPLKPWAMHLLWNVELTPSPGRSPLLGPWRLVGDSTIHPREGPPAFPFPSLFKAHLFSPLFSPSLGFCFFLHFYIFLEK